MQLVTLYNLALVQVLLGNYSAAVSSLEAAFIKKACGIGLDFGKYSTFQLVESVLCTIISHFHSLELEGTYVLLQCSWLLCFSWIGLGNLKQARHLASLLLQIPDQAPIKSICTSKDLAWFFLAVVNYLEKKGEHSIECLEHIAADDFWNASFLKGYLFLEIGEYNKALSVTEDLIRRQCTHIDEAYFLLGYLRAVQVIWLSA